MLRKLGGAMAGHDLLHHLLLDKSPCPIPRRALFIREKLFNGVVIQRGCSHVRQFGKSTIYARDFRSITSTRRANTRDACALICVIGVISGWKLLFRCGRFGEFLQGRIAVIILSTVDLNFLRVKRDLSIEHWFNYCPYENPGRLWSSNRQPCVEAAASGRRCRDGGRVWAAKRGS